MCTAANDEESRSFYLWRNEKLWEWNYFCLLLLFLVISAVCEGRKKHRGGSHGVKSPEKERERERERGETNITFWVWIRGKVISGAKGGGLSSHSRIPEVHEAKWGPISDVLIHSTALSSLEIKLIFFACSVVAKPRTVLNIEFCTSFVLATACIAAPQSILSLPPLKQPRLVLPDFFAGCCFSSSRNCCSSSSSFLVVH